MSDASQRRPRRAADDPSELVAELSTEGVTLWIGPSCRQLVGYEPEELMGRANPHLLHPEDRADALDALRRCLERDERVFHLHRVLRRDGSWCWFQSTLRAFRTPGGERRVALAAWPVGDRMEVEVELARQLGAQQRIAELSRHFLALPTEAVDDAIREHLGEAAELAGVERTRLIVTGERRGELLGVYAWCAEGTPGWDPGSAKLGFHFRFAVQTLVRGEILHVPDVGGLPEEAAAERADLRARGVRSLLVIPVRTATALIGFQIFERLAEPRRWSEREITQLRLVGEIFASALKRKYAEEALERLRVVERRVVELSQNLLALGAGEFDEGIESALAEAAQLAGSDRSYLIAFGQEPGASFESYEWCDSGIAPVPASRVGLPWSQARVLAGEMLHVPRLSDLPPEAEAERRSLSDRGVHSLLGIPVISSGRSIGFLGFETLHEEKEWSEQEVTLLRMVGGLFTSALRRKRIETRLRDSQDQLFQAQKLEAVGRLAGGIAHDFNNLLTVILGFSRPLLRELAEGDPVREDVREIHDSAERAAALTRQLLTFSRRQPVVSQRVDLGATVRGLEHLLRRLLGEDVELVLELAPDLGAVDVDPHQFEQVLLNLAVNARDAMPDGGRLHISTANQTVGRRLARQLGLARRGAHTLLRVSDSGCGMDDETRVHIFDPFFTTKEPGKGTGLGLAIVYSAVEQAAGAIAVTAEAGKGTSFAIYLPSVSGGATAELRAEEHSAGSGDESVLLVEDDPAVRRLTRRMLERSGYRVLDAADGVEALQLAESCGESIQLLLSDVVMPRLSGPELSKRLRQARPELRVLLISGYPRDHEVHAGVTDEGFLQKPFSEGALLEKVRQVLELGS